MTEDRDESPSERRDRHWGELLQELRVVQTGVQLLAGFLLTIPFQSRFGALDAEQRCLYLASVCLAFLSAGLLMAPVSLHRILFRRLRRTELVLWSDRLAKAGAAALALTMVLVITLIFDVVVGATAAWTVAGIAALFFITVWFVLPALIARGAPPRQAEKPDHEDAD